MAVRKESDVRCCSVLPQIKKDGAPDDPRCARSKGGLDALMMALMRSDTSCNSSFLVANGKSGA